MCVLDKILMCSGRAPRDPKKNPAATGPTQPKTVAGPEIRENDLEIAEHTNGSLMKKTCAG